MAGTTGLEPATSAVTGQRSNQLNYVPYCKISNLLENLAGQGVCKLRNSAHCLPVVPAMAAVPAKTANKSLIKCCALTRDLS
jgi:hypothetical protein